MMDPMLVYGGIAAVDATRRRFDDAPSGPWPPQRPRPRRQAKAWRRVVAVSLVRVATRVDPSATHVARA